MMDPIAGGALLAYLFVSLLVCTGLCAGDPDRRPAHLFALVFLWPVLLVFWILRLTVAVLMVLFYPTKRIP